MCKKAVLFFMFFSILIQPIFYHAVGAKLLAPFSPFAIDSTHSEPLLIREGMRYKTALVVSSRDSQNQVIASWLQRSGIPITKTAKDRFSALWELERISKNSFDLESKGDDILVVVDESLESFHKGKDAKSLDESSLIKTIKNMYPEIDIFMFAGTPLGRKASFKIEMTPKEIALREKFDRLIALGFLDAYTFSEFVILPLLDEKGSIIKLMGLIRFRNIIESLALHQTSPFLQEWADRLSSLEMESSL